MKFNNTPNKCYETEDGPVWKSRSVAVCALIMHVADDHRVSILLGKRGAEMMDAAGKWGLACGYLDWDESDEEAVVREVHEELGLLRDKKDFEVYELSTCPTKNRQNITIHSVIVLFGDDKPDPVAQEGEVSEAKWFYRDEIKEMDEGDFAFDHYNRILNATHIDGGDN